MTSPLSMAHKHPFSTADLKSMILASGLPRERFSEKIGVSFGDFQRILDGVDPISPQVRIRLVNMFGATSNTEHKTRDEWILGEGPPPRSREYVIHSCAPRFIARVLALEEMSDTPKPEEQPADTSRGVVYTHGPSLICEIDWIDPCPTDHDELMALLEAAAEQLDSDI